jgi:hypothetical protein
MKHILVRLFETMRTGRGHCFHFSLVHGETFVCNVEKSRGHARRVLQYRPRRASFRRSCFVLSNCSIFRPHARPGALPRAASPACVVKTRRLGGQHCAKRAARPDAKVNEIVASPECLAVPRRAAQQKRARRIIARQNAHKPRTVRAENAKIRKK